MKRVSLVVRDLGTECGAEGPSVGMGAIYIDGIVASMIRINSAGLPGRELLKNSLR